MNELEVLEYKNPLKINIPAKVTTNAGTFIFAISNPLIIPTIIVITNAPPIANHTGCPKFSTATTT